MQTKWCKNVKIDELSRDQAISIICNLKIYLENNTRDYGAFDTAIAKIEDLIEEELKWTT